MTVPRSRRPLVILAVLSAAFLIGFTMRGLISAASAPSEHADTPTAQANPRRSNSPVPSGDPARIPAGFARSKDGARAAAVAYVLAGQALITLSPSLVEAAVRSMSSSASADVQVATAKQQLDQLGQVLAPGTGPTTYLQAVLATRVDAYTSDRANVSVWNVGVLSRADVAAPQAGWNMSAFELVWERGDWKVWSEAISPGPAPALNAGVAPATAGELEAGLDGFTPWETP